MGTACDLLELVKGGLPELDKTKPVVLLSASATTRAALRSKGLPLRFSCSEACTTALTLRSGKVAVGTAKVSLNAAGNARARLRLTKKGKAAIKRARSLTLSADAADTSGNRGTDRLTLALR